MIIQSKIVDKVKKAVLSIDRDAKVILFGSRARGDAKPDSDWDLLILTSFEVNEQIKKKFTHKLFYVELETESAISLIIHSQSDWPNYEVTPLYQNIEEEGISL